MFNGALPPLGLDVASAALAVTRAVWLVGILSAGGGLLFAAQEPGGQDPTYRHRLMRLVLASLIVAAIGWLASVMGQTARFGGVIAPAAVLALLPDVLRQTAYGQVALAQIALLAAAAATLPLSGRGWARWLAAILALAAVGLQTGHLHAWAMEAGPGPLTAAALLHLLGAAAWLGGLLPLRLLVGGAQPARAALAARRFSRRAVMYVLMVVTGALGQGWELLGGLPGILGTVYGWVALLKALLLIVLVGFALHNRFRLTPALARPDPAPTRAALLRSITVETCIGILVVTAASLLGALQPGMHAEPVWPLTVQPSLERVRADPALAWGAAFAVLAVLVAVGLLAAMRGWRRWPALAVVLVVAWFAGPRLAPLFVPAVPTTFQTSPTGFAAPAIVAGAALYPQYCASCHGAEGRGDGPQAHALAMAPGDLTAPYLFDHSDGELFWWVSHGLEAPYGGLVMPGFADKLGADARWDLIDYLRARNAGLARDSAAHAVPDRAPDFSADCSDGRTLGLSDLRGRLVRLVFEGGLTPPPRVPEPHGVHVATVVVSRSDAPPPAGLCVVSDPAVQAAYAIAGGVPAATLDGSEVVIDQNGWLRAIMPPGTDDAALANTLLRIAATPVAATANPAHLHHHG